MSNLFGIIRPSIVLVLGCLAWCCACSGNKYLQGRGDVGKFILQRAQAFGGQPVSTNGLPAIGGDWRYVEDEFGVGILLPASQLPSVRDFLQAAFGPASNAAGWAARDCGVAIMLQQESSNAVLGVYPLMSDEPMARGMRRIAEAIEKNTR